MLDGFNGAVVRCGSDGEVFIEPVDGLMVSAVHAHAGGPGPVRSVKGSQQFGELRSPFDLDFVAVKAVVLKQVLAAVPGKLRHVLDQRAAQRDIQDLQTPTDRQRWDAVVNRVPSKGDLDAVTFGEVFLLMLVRGVAALEARVDVGSAH